VPARSSAGAVASPELSDARAGSRLTGNARFRHTGNNGPITAEGAGGRIQDCKAGKHQGTQQSRRDCAIARAIVVAVLRVDSTPHPVIAAMPRSNGRILGLDPWAIGAVVLALVLALLVLNPVLRLLVSSVTAPRDGFWTLANYIGAFSRPRYVQAFWTSMQLGVAVTAICFVVAVPLAWAVSRTDMPGKASIRLLVLSAFVMPPYLGAIGWILLAGPNSGWLNVAWRAATGAEGALFDIYSFTGLAFVIALYTFPFLFVFTTGALDVVSSEMEDAANILGAGTLATARRVTLPLVLPALLAGGIISFLETISLVGTPALIALPARVNVITTQLTQFFSPPIRAEVAAAYTMPLLLVTVALYALQQRLLRRRGFVTLGGKGGERRMIRLGVWRWVLFGYAALVLVLALVLPSLVLAQAAFAKAWGRGWRLDNLTLDNFSYLLFNHPGARGSIVNSFEYAGAAATIALLLAVGVAYVVSRRLVRFGNLLGVLCMTPFVIPGIVLAIAFYGAYAPPPFSLYGTGLIMILAFTTRFLPVAYSATTSSIRSINPEMEEAVRILGGGRWLAIRRVLAPLMKRSLFGAWLLVFIPASRELSTAMFLYGPSTRPMSIMLLDLSEEGNFELLAALGFMLLAATLIVVVLGMRLVGRDFMVRRSRE
jgi:iron(III) transport system permease protein